MFLPVSSAVEDKGSFQTLWCWFRFQTEGSGHVTMKSVIGIRDVTLYVSLEALYHINQITQLVLTL